MVLLAKQTGTNGEKMADLLYPTAITFDATAASAGFSQIDLTQAGLVDPQTPVIIGLPDLSPLAAGQTPGKPIWIVTAADPAKILFSVQAKDGIHVAWPDTAADPAMQQAAVIGLKNMQDFYDTRTLLGSFSGGDGSDIYSLVMMKRMGATYTYNADKIPWSLVILRWKYDAEQKKATLLNRAPLAIGRIEGNSPLPEVFKQPELLRDISNAK